MAHNQLSQIFVLANEFKEGDLNVGGTRDDHIRREARDALAALSLGEIARAEFVEDQVTEALHRSLDPQLAGKVAHLTVAELRQILLVPGRELDRTSSKRRLQRSRRRGGENHD